MARIWHALVVSGVLCGLSLCAATLPAEDAERNVPASETYLLRYRFSADETLHYRVSNESTIDVRVADKEDTVRHTSDSVKRLRVESVNEEGLAELEVTILHVRMSAESGGDVITYDSRSDEETPDAFVGVQQTVGRPWTTVTVSPSGTVVDVRLSGAGAAPDELDATQLELLPVLPEQPVAVGETWREPFEVQVLVAPNQPLKKTVRLERVYSLRSVSVGVALIDLRTVVLSPLRDPFLEGQLIQRTTRGRLRFDLERGRLLERSLGLDNSVVGFQGAQSALSVVSTRNDELIPAADLAAEDRTSRAQR